MRKLTRKWAFKASMIDDAPENPGVYALWEGDRLLYVGRAGGGRDSIRARLMDHYERARDAGPVPTHYSWEISIEPHVRHAEALQELGLAA